MESETLREISTGLGVGESYTVLSTIKEGRLYLAARAGNGSFLPGTWEIVPINKESPFPTDHYHVLSYVRNGTESGYITTYLYKMEYSFTGDGRGTLRAEVSGDGFASGMVTNHYTPGGWYLGSSATLDFFFEMTGTLSAQFSWKINAGGELELHLLNSSRKVTSKPLTEGFGRCEPTYLKRLMKELNSSYRSHPDVKKTEKVVNYNLEMLRGCANKVLNIMIDEEGKLFLLDDFLLERVRLRREKSRRVEIIILVAVIGLVVIPFVLSFLLELTNKKGVATALKSALSATGSYLADTCLKLVVFIYAVGYIFGVWG